MIRRVLPLVFLVILSAPLAGCWVLDELDSGKKIMDAHSAKSPGEKEADAKKPGAAASAPGGKDAVDTYFRGEEEDGTTKTFAPGSMSEGIVACKLGGSTQFMTRENCAARGGQASGA
ncbi:MAG TPA: hypothetical protein VFT98_05560 [Myxococcota bacterium]|nr:hypothetical protein [Myxococcota bacterium]